ncbi:molybdenum ABC transporter permease [Pandoraea sp.]|uniref:molybdate ABC transporter permease subunit n=1 Tax=Pandoraea sp. TaxID=1883445 RepID=UPI001221FE54|nr:ABC transporter permease subunit [Pandoraea sp.]TAL54682.1 MAG: ABC transporter permease subunit [Pandoraea sp.]TAM18550.1 MAG: ABC transporter permease subunit [Pandoraea sp.]
MSAQVDLQVSDGLPRARAPALLGALTLLLIAGPFIGLACVTPWRDFHFFPGDTRAIAVSLVYSLLSLGLIIAFGTPLAWWLARHAFRGKWLLEAVILLALLTPPLAMGILLATLYGPYGPAGSLAARAGVELTNSAPAFILAQCYGALPYFVVAARAAFEGVPRELEHIALTLGKTPWQTFWLVSMPLARLGLAAGVALAWVRALGEFGVVLIVAYYPQGIPVKLWVNLQDIGLPAVYPLLWVFFLVAMPLPLILGLASRRQRLF